MIRKYGVRILNIIMSVVIVLGTVFTYQYAKEDSSGKQAEAAALPTEEYTESHPLTVIEIVPYLMFAEFGYHIDGGEIVDFKKIQKDTEAHYANSSGKDLSGTMNSFCGLSAVGIDIDGESNPPLYACYSKELFKRESLGEDYVSDELLKKQAIHKRLQEEINTTSDETHKKKCEKKLESYQYTKSEKAALEKFNSVKVVYKAVLISEVNQNPSMLDNADLILITGVCASGASETLKDYLKEEYAGKLKYPNDSEYIEKMKVDPYSYDVEERLSWEAADHIFKLSTEIGGVPVIINKRALDDAYPEEKKQVVTHYTKLDENNNRQTVAETAMMDGCSNNMYKLFLMLYQKDPYIFRNDFYRYVNEKGEFTLQSGDARQYWNYCTFMEYSYGDKLNAGQNYSGNILLTNGMTWNSDNSFYTGFTTSGIINTSIQSWTTDTGGCYAGSSKFSKDVVEYFGTDKTSITPAEAIKFLLMNHKRSTKGIEKETLHVLELEPSNEFTMTESTIQSYLSDYAGTVEITYMTSAQFNSTKTDLAGTYDLIVLGDNTGGLSVSDRNSNIYMAAGDKVEVSVLGTVETAAYSGNDITKEKREELSKYLQAGLPMIIADTLYQGNQLDSTSNMYGFLKEDAKEAKEKNQIVTQSKAVQTPTTVTSQLISYLNAYRPEVSNVTARYSSTSLSATFAISNMDLAGEEVTLRATLYAILDQQKGQKESEIGTITIKEDGTYTIQGTDSAIKTADAAICYRLVVTQQDDANRYAAISGTVKRNNAAVSTIRVLQIAPEKTTVDLSDPADIVGRYVSSVTEERIEVTKLTVNEFVAMYDKEKGGSPYQSGNLLTNRLIGYDVLVFGCSKNYPTISNSNGALDNVIDFIESKRSVIFTNGVLQPVKSNSSKKTKQAYQTLRELAGMQQSGYTNAYLNVNKVDDTSYTMYDISGGDSRQSTAGYATLVNNSPVSSYPYDIKFETISQQTTKDCNKNPFSAIAIHKEAAGIWPANLSKITGYYALADQDLAGRKQFSASPNDVQNNYYLYQSGSIWYSGIGCSTLSSSQEQEAKLFVNTIVAAALSAAKAPTVSFVETNKDSNGKDTVFVEADVVSDHVEVSKELTFIPYDTKGKAVKTSIYVKSGDHMYEITHVTKQGSSGKITLSNTALMSDTHYDMTIPAEYMSSNDCMVYVYVQNENGIGMAECQIIRRNEFDLD